MTTVNVDIFACINLREFAKIDNFARIYIRIFDNIASKGYDKKVFSHCTYFHRHFKTHE